MYKKPVANANFGTLGLSLQSHRLVSQPAAGVPKFRTGKGLLAYRITAAFDRSSAFQFARPSAFPILQSIQPTAGVPKFRTGKRLAVYRMFRT